MATPQSVCANWDLDNTNCNRVGGYTCKNCYLVAYCRPDCQKSHWISHKIDCKSPLSKASRRPDWSLENRKPAFFAESLALPFGGKKFLWGNIPALDVLQLESNEGGGYGGRLGLLFAASGDLRNVIKSITHIPSSYNQPVDVAINDRDLDIVARNAILLLIAFIIDDIDEAVESIIHAWYSALIRKCDLDLLQHLIRPLIESVCEKIKGKTSSSRLGKTWKFGQRSLRLMLEKSSWDRLLSYMDVPEGLTTERANQIRTAVTLAEARSSDCNDSVPGRWTPDFFQTTDVWPMCDNADPLNGWSLKEVESISSGPATADIYGKLFYYIRALHFLLRISNLEICIRLFQVDVSELPDLLDRGSFNRIEVSNISDAGYLGIPRTIFFTVPLLQEPLTNPHATLITLFMNAVDENTTKQDRIADVNAHSVTTNRLAKYLPPKGLPTNSTDPELIKFIFARGIVATFDRLLGGGVSEKELYVERKRIT